MCRGALEPPAGPLTSGAPPVVGATVAPASLCCAAALRRAVKCRPLQAPFVCRAAVCSPWRCAASSSDGFALRMHRLRQRLTSRLTGGATRSGGRGGNVFRRAAELRRAREQLEADVARLQQETQDLSAGERAQLAQLLAGEHVRRPSRPCLGTCWCSAVGAAPSPNSLSGQAAASVWPAHVGAGQQGSRAHRGTLHALAPLAQHWAGSAPAAGRKATKCCAGVCRAAEGGQGPAARRWPAGRPRLGRPRCTARQQLPAELTPRH